MNTKKILKSEIEKLSESKAEEALNYIRFLLKQEQDSFSNMIVSEPSLAKDWLKDEENDAWADL